MSTESLSNNLGVGPRPSEDKPGKEHRRPVSAERYGEEARRSQAQPQPAEASRDYCSGSEPAAESVRSRRPAELEVLLEAAGRRHTFEVDLGAVEAEEPAAEGFSEAEELLARPPAETERVRIVVHTAPAPPTDDLEKIDVELRLGTVAIASTCAESPEVARLARIGPNRLETAVYQPFLDCAGMAHLDLLTRWSGEDLYQRIARIPMRILPAKISPEELDQLVSELEEAARGVLFDAYSKTLTGLRRGGSAAERPPIEELEAIRSLLNLFGTLLERISNRPAQRLTLSPRRVGIYPGESITPETLLSLAEDASLLTRTRAGVLPRERIEMAAERDARLPEHTALSGFLAFLAEETRRNIARIQAEAERRRRGQRNFAPGPSGIWAKREAPRILALQGLEAGAKGLLSRARDLRRRHEFLPADAPPLRRPPDLTKRFAHVGAYAVLYRAMREYFKGHEVDLEDWNLLVGAKSLPVLWEYWVVLKVIRFLQRKLHYAFSPWESSGSLFRRLGGFRDRYTYDLASDRRLELSDAAGRRIVFRYQPRYVAMSGALGPHGAAYGRLKRRGAPYEPDIALELYPAGAPEAAVPEHIVLLDAKYTSRSHDEVLQSLLRYRNIGELRTGRRLVRQIWALTNAFPPQHGLEGTPALETDITLDNEAFFDSAFSAQGEVCGAIGLRPGKERAQEPLELLLTRVFAIFGVV